MDTAKQAMENMEYVCSLLEGKRPGFATSVELAVSFIRRQIEWPEETMEMTLPPGRHGTIEKQDPVHEWRVARLARLGIPWPVAEAGPCPYHYPLTPACRQSSAQHDFAGPLAGWSYQTRRRSGRAGSSVREVDVRADARRR